jgi:hypothetical protein
MNSSDTDVKSLTNIEEWLSNFSKDAYAAYAKIDSVNERVRTLTPPMTALGVGYIYEATRYTYKNGITDTLFFYLPLGIGAILVIVAIFLMLWALVGQSKVEVLAEANEILEAVKSHKDNVSLSELENQAIIKRCNSATKNCRILKTRTMVLVWGAWLAIAAFALLIASTPKFVHNQITETHPQNNE